MFTGPAACFCMAAAGMGGGWGKRKTGAGRNVFSLRLYGFWRMHLAWTPAEGVVCLATVKRGNINFPSQAALVKMRYDKEHKDSLSKYPEKKERIQSLLQNGDKITPKQWKAEIQSLQSEYDSIGREQTRTAAELAYAEALSCNKKNLERELQNESRQRNRQQSRTRRREKVVR